MCPVCGTERWFGTMDGYAWLGCDACGTAEPIPRHAPAERVDPTGAWRVCTGCGARLALSAFGHRRDRSYGDGYDRMCHPCRARQTAAFKARMRAAGHLGAAQSPWRTKGGRG
jgi:hypothetical protein